MQELVGYNFFRHAWGIELSMAELQDLKEWTTVFQPFLAGMGTESGGARCGELGKQFEVRLTNSEFGSKFLTEAQRRGMDGEARLREMLFEFVFAGFGGGGPGVGFMVIIALLMTIGKSPEHFVPLFEHDPSAFVLEAARLYGGGGAGMNPFIIPETQSYTLGTGTVFTERAGKQGWAFNTHANRDPAVFGGPSADQAHANLFSPGRENADRTMTWVSELKDIRKCPNMTGCAAAPRFCLGAFLSQRIAVQVLEFYMQGLVKPKTHSSKAEEM
jgi:hypothetical protein